MSQQNITIPAPPAGPKKFYFVFGEFVRQQGSAIATAINPEGQVRQTRIGINDVISMDPCVWAWLCQEARPGYTVKYSHEISSDLYHWYKAVEATVQKQMAAANGNAGKGIG
jgi:hypothetical protein